MSRRSAVVACSMWVLLATLPAALGLTGTAVDPLLRYQWGLRAIHATTAWRYAVGKGVIVAVVDGGVDYNNEDLRGRVILSKGLRTICSPSRQRCDGSDVHADKHATMIAGIIAARKGNGKGIAGVAPEARIISIEGLGFDKELSEGIRFAVDRGARVISMSFGNLTRNPRLVQEPMDQTPDGRVDVNLGGKHVERALKYAWSKGAVLVAAAGNDALPYCNFPASAENTLCVGATDSRDLKTGYSNFGYGLDLVAPGGIEGGLRHCDDSDLIDEQIVSTSTADSTYCGVRGYRNWWGTSFAAPHVAGVAALLISKGLKNTQVVDCLYRTADDLGAPGYDPIYGHGLVNAYRAVRNCHR